MVIDEEDIFDFDLVEEKGLDDAAALSRRKESSTRANWNFSKEMIVLDRANLCAGEKSNRMPTHLEDTVLPYPIYLFLPSAQWSRIERI